jgi:hypothetical protein
MNSLWTLLLLTAITLSFPSTSLAEVDTEMANTMGHQSDKTSKQPRSIAYLTSWNLPGNAPELLGKSKADAYMVSFAKWDENGHISSSDDIIEMPADNPKRIPLGYLTWTQTAHFTPQTQMIISFGGQDYEGIWDSMGSKVHSEVIATNIAKLLMTDFPVYQKALQPDCQEAHCKDDANYQLIGHTQLSGIDFDFEQASRLTLKQNQQLAFLARRVRELVGENKSVILTTYHVGADPLSCRNSSVIKDCSFRELDRSSHHGEVLSLLQATLGVFDFYNIMTYDAGRNFDYKTSINNYLKIISNRSKLRLGMSINRQWGQFGGFVMPLDENLARAKWQAKQGYGGFFIWALGANTESRTLDSQIRIFNSLVNAATPASTK